MTAKAISHTVELISQSSAQDQYRLAGAYKVRSNGGAEIELVDEVCWRSVIYVRAGSDIILFLPPSRYRIFVRPFEDAAVHVSLVKMGAMQRLAFYLAKGAALFDKSPKDAFRSIFNFFKRSRGGLVVAARTGNADPGVARTEPYRRELSPAADSQQRASVSIIIPTKERFDLLRACIGSLSQIKGVVYDVVVVDNGATHPEMLAYLRELSLRDDVEILRRDIPFNFSRLCNDGARMARHSLLLFLNDDIEGLDENWLAEMVAFAEREDAGVVGARLLYPSGALQHAGIATNLIPGPGHPWRGAPREIWTTHPLLSRAGEVDAVTGACLMIRRDLFNAVGGFNEDEFAVTLNDVDLCLRVRQLGRKVIYVPGATLIHKESQTRLADDNPKEALRYRRELRTFYQRYMSFAQTSIFYPESLRRDSDAGAAIPDCRAI